MKRLLTSILLLLVAGVAFADSSALTSTQQFASGLNPPETDYSIAYLSQIFGTVGTVLQGSSGQILGKMFDIFNKGLMVVAAIWLGVTTIHLSLKASQEGSFMGQNKNVAFVMLRIAMGFALIIPSSTTGYSLLQDIFMKVVVQSVGLADEVWDSALNYIEYGGKLYIPPSTVSTDTTFVSNCLGTAGSTPTAITNGNFRSLPVVSQIFQDEVCMIRSSSAAWNPPSLDGPSLPLPQYQAQFHPNQGAILFPGLGNEAETVTTKNASCGSVASVFCATSSVNASLCWSSAAPPTPLPTLTQTQQAEKDEAYEAMKQLVIALQPAAQAYVDYANPVGGAATPSLQDFINTNAKAVFTAMLDYSNLISPYQTMMSANGTQNTDFIANAEAQGWIMAGAYYWNVQRTNKDAAAISIDKLLPISRPPSSIIPSSRGTTAMPQTELVDAAQNIIGTGTDNPGYAPVIATLWGQYVGAQQNNVSGPGGGGSSGGGSAASMMNTIINNSGINSVLTWGTSTAVGGYFSGSGGNCELAFFTALVSNKPLPSCGAVTYNPITTLMNIGESLLVGIVNLWYAAIALTVGIAVVAGICNSTSPTGIIFETAITWIKSMLMMIVGLLIVPAVILTYYVPLYPFALFTFAVVGWLLMVVQGMAAAPLICVGMTHPEGHDFLGKSEQALMFFLSIFLRPALQVIGLIASMIVSYTAFAVVLAGFMQYNNSVGVSLASASHDGDLVSLITGAMGMIALSVITFEVMEQCYKLIFQLPDAVMKWIGGPQMGEDYSQMAGKVQGAVSAAGSGVKEGAQSLDRANDGAAKGIGKARKAHDKNPGDGGGGDIQGGQS